MIKRILSILIVTVILLGCTVFSASSVEKDTTTVGASLEIAESAVTRSEVEAKLNSIVNSYNGKTVKDWQLLRGTECKGFANWVFQELFGYFIGTYPENKPYVTNYNANLTVEVGVIAPNGANASNAKELLKKAYPGDFIQAKTKSQHSMIFMSCDDYKCTVLDCNYKHDNVIRKRDFSWSDFGDVFKGLSLYHAKNYDVATVGHVMSESEAAGQTIPDGDYWVCSAIAQSYFLDVPGNEPITSNGANVQMWIWNSSMPTQYDVFHFEYLNNGFYKITLLNSNMALDVDANSLNMGTNVQLWSANGSNAQQWSVEDSGTGYRLRARCSAYYLDVYGGNCANGTNVRTWEGNGSKAQGFSLIPYAPTERPSPTVSTRSGQI